MAAMPPPSRPSWAGSGLVPWLAVVALYALIRVPLLPTPLERDEGLFAVIGQRILAGEVPYRDVFEHKPPGIFYVYALAVALVPATTVGLHSFLAVWNLLTLLAVGAVARSLAGRRAGIWAGLLFAMGSAAPSVQGFTASSEMMLLLPLTVSLWWALRGARAVGRARTAWLAASGAAGALAVWIKQPAALALAIVPLVILFDAGPHDSSDPARSDAALRRSIPGPTRRRAMIGLGAGLAGALVTTIVLVVPFLVAGVWSEFVYWAFTHSLLYGQVSATSYGLRLTNRALDVAMDLGPALTLAILGTGVDLARRRPRAWVAPAFLALSVASALHSPFLYIHYFALLVPAVAIAGGVGLAALCARAEEGFGRRPAQSVAVLGLAVVLAAPVLARPWYWLGPDPVEVVRRVLGAQGFEAAPDVAAFLRERTRPDETFFVYGSEPQISFLAERRDPNPFVVVYPLTWSWPRHREFQRRVWAEIERRPPAYLVIARSPFSLSRSPAADDFLEDRLSELGKTDYEVEAVVYESTSGRARLGLVTSLPERVAPEQILLEIWRRREGPESAAPPTS